MKKGLKAAMEMLEIQPDESRYFHNALHDAYYTALVFAKLPRPEDVLKYPQQPKLLIHSDKRQRQDGQHFDTVREAFAVARSGRPGPVLIDIPKDVTAAVTDYEPLDAVKVAVDNMNIDASKRNILVTHQFVTGATRSESEDISVGGTDNVDASVFECFDYVALGHIHRSQKCGGGEYIRYSGTPLKYSFSEAKDNKTVTVVEMSAKGNIILDFIPLVPKRDMVEIKGTYDELTLKSFYENTTYQDDYIHITLTDEEDIPDVLTKLRVIYKNIMKLDYDNRRTRNMATVDGVGDVEKKSPFEHFSDFYEKPLLP